MLFGIPGSALHGDGEEEGEGAALPFLGLWLGQKAQCHREVTPSLLRWDLGQQEVGTSSLLS